MKNIISITTLFLVLLTSCDDDNTKSDSQVKTEVESRLKIGTWRITNFNDSGSDETAFFSSYNFTFAATGVLTATNGTSTFSGTWNITDDDSSDDSPDDLDFNILFSVGNNFDELAEDWQIVSQTETKIELIHTSGGGGGTDYLTFQKN